MLTRPRRPPARWTRRVWSPLCATRTTSPKPPSPSTSGESLSGSSAGLHSRGGSSRTWRRGSIADGSRCRWRWRCAPSGALSRSGSATWSTSTRSRRARLKRSSPPIVPPRTRPPAKRSCVTPEARRRRPWTRAALLWARGQPRSPRSSTRSRTACASCRPWISPDFPTPSGASWRRAGGRSWPS